MSLWKIISALLEGADGLWRLDRELRHWRFTVCFYAGVIFAGIPLVIGQASRISEVLAGVIFAGMLGMGIWWDR
jgi:hypothetical protein